MNVKNKEKLFNQIFLYGMFVLFLFFNNNYRNTFFVSAFTNNEISLIGLLSQSNFTDNSQISSELSKQDLKEPKTSLEKEPKIEDIDEDQRNELNSCEVFCLQPDVRLCQCTKDELNKYLPGDLAESSKESKISTNSSLPHIYMSSKEKETCGEYSIMIRKLNIAINRNLNLTSDFFFEPSMDFQVEAPNNHTISNLFYWGDWLAFYQNNPYSEFDNYLPGCVWQIPSGKKSFYSTVTVNSCRNQLVSLVSAEVKTLHLCVWSYERYWLDKQSGPCLCCEINFSDCNECFKCIKNNKPEKQINNGDSDDWINKCLVDDSNFKKNEFSSLSCYKCLNFKNTNFNCQDYNQFLSKVISNNKYQELTKRQKQLFDLN